MERPILWVLLMCVLVLPLAAEEATKPEHEPIIEPELDRRNVKLPRIDTENFQIRGYAGVLNIEDFGTEFAYGLRAAYHITEDFFVEGTYGLSQVSDDAFRRFGLPLFPNETEDVTYYNVALGINVLPGEVFIGPWFALTSAVYVVGGLGNTSIADEDEFTYTVGFGVDVVPVDWLSLRVDVRDYMFESDRLGESELTHNFELSGGLGIFF